MTEPINQGEQAAAIFGSFAAWLKERPGRRIVFSRDNGGFSVRLDEERECHGGTLQDASAQAAQVAGFEVAST